MKGLEREDLNFGSESFFRKRLLPNVDFMK